MKNNITIADHDSLVGASDEAFEYADFRKPKSPRDAIALHLCNKILQAKRESNLTVKEFCDRGGLSEDTYSNINFRRVDLLSNGKLLYILKRLEVDPNLKSEEFMNNDSDLKNRLEVFQHKNIMFFPTKLEKIKGDICLQLSKEFKSPEDFIDNRICGLVDARKILSSRCDLLTLEFLVKVLSNTGRKAFAASFKEDLLAKYNVSAAEVVPDFNKEAYTEEFKRQTLSLDRLVEYIDIKQGFKESAEYFLLID